MLFYRCMKCGNFVTFLGEKTACTPTCCGEPMTELKANTSDGAVEKHVPVVELDGNKVTVSVGSTLHPMLDNHYIEFVVLETEHGFYKRDFKPGDEPVCQFLLPEGEKALRAYAYCNLHGLWKSEEL